MGVWAGQERRKLWNTEAVAGGAGCDVLQQFWVCSPQALERSVPTKVQKGHWEDVKEELAKVYISYTPGRGWDPASLPLPRVLLLLPPTPSPSLPTFSFLSSTLHFPYCTSPIPSESNYYHFMGKCMS